MGASVFFESSSELARLSNTFTVSEVATDPTTVALTLTSPTGTATTYTYAAAEITKDSTGVYHRDVTCSEAGEWVYRWVGTGAATDTTIGTFTVQETTVGRLYATVEALKSRLGVEDTVDDYELHAACFAASRAVEQHCQRTFWRTASDTVRTFEAETDYRVRLSRFSDLVSLTTLATDQSGDGTFETTWDASDYQLLPLNPTAAPEIRPYNEIHAIGSRRFPRKLSCSGRIDRVQITGVFGWPSVPPSIKQAALILAQETFRAKDSVGGVAGFGEFGVVRLTMNPLYAAFLEPYQLSQFD